jgi:serine/threonine-protein kinase RsbT
MSWQHNASPAAQPVIDLVNLQGDGAEVVLSVRTDDDVVRLRKLVREALLSMRFSVVDQTKMVTAASELARNTLRYGGGGDCSLAKVGDGSRNGLALTFVDQGPGIADVSLALTDGYTTGGGMGLGLSGAKRLADVFELQTSPNIGTTVKIIKWKPY